MGARRGAELRACPEYGRIEANANTSADEWPCTSCNCSAAVEKSAPMGTLRQSRGSAVADSDGVGQARKNHLKVGARRTGQEGIGSKSKAPARPGTLSTPGTAHERRVAAAAAAPTSPSRKTAACPPRSGMYLRGQKRRLRSKGRGPRLASAAKAVVASRGKVNLPLRPRLRRCWPGQSQRERRKRNKAKKELQSSSSTAACGSAQRRPRASAQRRSLRAPRHPRSTRQSP